LSFERSPPPPPRRRPVLPALAALGCLFLLLLSILALLLQKPRWTYWRGRNISIQAQSLKAGAFSGEGFWIRDGWDDPHGHRRGKLYGLKVGSKLLRLDIVYDPIADIKKHLPTSIPGLLKELESKDGLVQECALEALLKLGPDAAAALPVLLDRYATTTNFPDWSIVEVSKAAGLRAIPFLTNALANENPRVQAKVIESLGEMGSNAAPAVPALARLLTNAPPTNIVAAAYALSHIEHLGHGEVAALTRALSDPDEIARGGAIVVLAEFHEDAAPAAEALLNFIDPANRPEADCAARTFAAMGPAGKVAVPRLITLLDHLAETNTTFPIEALGDIGEAASPALPKLFEIAGRPDRSQFTSAAARAMGKIGSNSIPYLLQLYEQEEPHYGNLSAAVTTLGPRAAPLVPRLISELDSYNVGRVTAAAIALGAIGQSAKSAVPALSSKTQDEDPRVRVRAAEALWNIANETNTVLPVMIRELDEWSKGTNALIQVESDSHGESRQQVAARILAEIGPAAQSAVPLLQFMQRSTFQEQRAAAANALKNITEDR